MSLADAWQRAEQALDRRQFGQAAALFRQALAADPRHVPSLIGLSTALSKLGRHRDAHAAAIAASDAKPQEAPLLFALGQRLGYFHEFERMVECLGNPALAAMAPATVLARSAVLLSSIGAHAEAAVLVERALVREPTNAACLYVRGNLHFFAGANAEAQRCYEASLRSDPALFQNSWMLASAVSITGQHNHVERLREQLGRARPGGNGEVYLNFALHRELDELGRYPEAWDALKRGCAAKRRQMPYDPRPDRLLADAVVEQCDASFVARCSGVEQPHVPIFIVGMHRSGTTLLERMLAGHSEVGDAGETSAFHAEVELATNMARPAGPDAELIRAATKADFDAIARGYAARARWLSRGRRCFTEKLPQNFLNLGLIARALPQARFLHMVRDPMDTCFSNLRQLFSGAAPYSYDQHELAGFYLEYRRVMAHWRSVLGDRLLDVSYEALLADPEGMARRVARHCGLEFEPAMVDAERAAGSVATPSAMVVRSGFQRNRSGVWQRYAEHLQPLLERLGPAYAEDRTDPPTIRDACQTSS